MNGFSLGIKVMAAARSVMKGFPDFGSSQSEALSCAKLLRHFLTGGMASESV
jgi:hypothetical protein